MPSKSDAQARTMRAAANDAGYARRMGIPQEVAREFVAADTQRPPRPAPQMTSDQRKTVRYGGTK